MMTSIQVFPDCALPAEQPGGQDGQSQKYETNPKNKWRFITGKIIHYFSGFNLYGFSGQCLEDYPAVLESGDFNT
jgi:hypothetical protein